ncbi:circadian clock protein KaiC [Mariprofundus erugo]|uniref:non-specific serine/threonine protein kinase n=1 Tax=Mariprofundus erugo TaxID=2528639 RepID=A0A5R9GTX5_9PROT|nr:circadian clock protein KaiC [Mariprofundus erugo]TLS66694.1 circadian clock protein KaiC [Mariprofundus erugo]TLS74562.1 circadian clock protein KaiC [Mariprofundus erugo]
MNQLSSVNQLKKCPTGITGFDRIADGGLPAGRSTLICGSAGSGKSLFGIEFLAHGIQLFHEPGVFVSFEERSEDIIGNVASIGLALQPMVAAGKLKILPIDIDAHTLHEAGEYDLEPLFIRIGAAIQAVAAKRIVLDAVENLFSAFQDQSILRAEFKRLLCWLKEQGITAVITTEKGEQSLTRRGIEEYLADCVVLLDLRVTDQVATRMLRITKYRGSGHGADEYPFLIDDTGIVCMPINQYSLDYPVSNRVFPSGITRLDQMLGGGIYYGSTLLVSGGSGSGKSTIAGQFVDAACGRGEKTLYLALEESPAQIMRNLKSLNIDLQQWLDHGLLAFVANRPSVYGLEMQMAVLMRQVRLFEPALVVIDPITALHIDSSSLAVKRMLQRTIDQLKARGVTMLFTTLTWASEEAGETTSSSISSLMDAWIQLRSMESSGERSRGLYVIKSRGARNSNQIREFLITHGGVSLKDVMLNAAGEVVTGSERYLMQVRQAQAAKDRKTTEEQQRLELESRYKTMQARVSALMAEFEAEKQSLERKWQLEAIQSSETEMLIHQVSERRSAGVSDDE